VELVELLVGQILVQLVPTLFLVLLLRTAAAAAAAVAAEAAMLALVVVLAAAVVAITRLAVRAIRRPQAHLRVTMAEQVSTLTHR
jgi:hypothetical protein